MRSGWRKSGQALMPGSPEKITGSYNIYPFTKLADGIIFKGYKSVAEYICQYETIIVDGYQGVFFEPLIETLSSELTAKGTQVNVVDFSRFLKPESQISSLIEPYLGGDDPLFGRRAEIDLSGFFETDKLPEVNGGRNCVNLIYGTGSALCGWEGLLVYIDLPKNELQYRARAGSITNLGASEAQDIKMMYKRFYFVDWVVLNRHKQIIADKIDVLIDGQNPDNLVWIRGNDFREGLRMISRNVFRVRPWFEPGPWGGQWIKNRIPGLNRDAVNYAWSFELIVPENGLILESSGILLEFSFDFMMFLNSGNVLGKHSDRYGSVFPIRFDFLDTFDGGNLSVQCHPHLEYIRENFGEEITQEEAYYILDTKDDARCYLGFREGINPEEFRQALIKSRDCNEEFSVDNFVLSRSTAKHDFYLIPPGTIHGSGRNNVVLEISTTPYIFTFKMYDWLRADLDGRPRALNIERAMDNLNFDRQGKTVDDELVSLPVLLEENSDWQLYELPTHAGHSYKVLRYHFISRINISTNDTCQVLNLVQGTSISLRTMNGMVRTFHYAETFVVPAAAKSYTLLNQSDKTAIVVIAFLKDELV
jgi:mannose-6-phosphate isomerase class I